jgi:hypothetical protein
MSNWSERVAAHGVWQVLKELEITLENAEKREGLDSLANAALDRVRTVMRFVSQRLESADPLLVNLAVLDATSAALTRVRDEVTHFSGNGDLGHLTNANTHADAVLVGAAPLPVVVSGNEVRTLGRAAAEYRRGLESVLDSVKAREAGLTQKVSATEQKLLDLQSAVDVVKAGAETFLTSARSSFQQSQEARQVEGARTQSDVETRFQSLTAELAAKTTEAISEFAALRVATQTRVDAELAAIRSAHASSASQVLADMLAQKARADELVGIIGERGVTAGYQAASRHAMWTKWFWQVTTIAAFAVLIWFAKTVFFSNVSTEVTWPMLVGRALLTIAIGFAAAYAARQGDKAAQAEAVNRGMALELAALGPFLEPLDEAKRAEFRLKIGDRTFGQAYGSQDGRGSPTGLLNAVSDKRLLEALATLAKIVKGQ